MRVMHVTTGSGRPVTLDFDDTGVAVRAVSVARQRAVRVGAGALILACGLAAVAGNADDRTNHTFADVVWAITAAALATGLGAGVWWLVLARRSSRAAPEVITTADIRSARSVIGGSQITVRLQTADGADREFSAHGHNGALLAQQFGALLGVTEQQ